MGKPLDVAIVGGGVRGCLTALALHRLRPELSLRLFEKNATLGGGPVAPMEMGALAPALRSFLDPLLVVRWRQAMLGLAAGSQSVATEIAMTVPIHLHVALLEEMADRVLLSLPVRRLDVVGVESTDGITPARVVLDFRPRRQVAGDRITVATSEYAIDHQGALRCPILFDADRQTADARHIWQYFPITARRLLVRVVNWGVGEPLTEVPPLGDGHICSYTESFPRAGRAWPQHPLLPSALDVAVRQAFAIANVRPWSAERVAQAMDPLCWELEDELAPRSRWIDESACTTSSVGDLVVEALTPSHPYQSFRTRPTASKKAT